ncbi:MAG: hypothetical protein LBT82_00560 [Oscillospiraceae bacterium]|jgi:hypothetical protein|nr:hypothetical protein [Oscillospiraceae bacterium]
MKNEIYYAFKEFLKHPTSFLALAAQMFISFYLLFYGLYSTFNLTEENNKIKKLAETKNGYCLFSSTDDGTFFANFDFKKNGKEKLQEMYSFLNNNQNFKLLTSRIKFFPSFPSDRLRNFSNSKDLSCVFVNKNFKDVFDLRCKEGEFLDDKDFEYKDKSLFIVLGNAFKNYFKVGEKIKISDTGMSFFPDEGRNMELTVKGFLEHNSYFLQFSNGDNFVNLDKMIIFPLNSNMTGNPFFERPQGVLDECICLTTIMTDDIDKSFDEINKFAFDKKIYTYSNFYSWKNYSQDIIKTSNDRALSAYFLFFSISAFAIVNAVLSLFMMIEKSKYKIYVNMLCGCTIKNIILRFVFQISLTIFTSLIVSAIVVGNFNILSTIFVVLLSVSIILAISLLVVNKLKNINIGQLTTKKD